MGGPHRGGEGPSHVSTTSPAPIGAILRATGQFSKGRQPARSSTAGIKNDSRTCRSRGANDKVILGNSSVASVPSVVLRCRFPQPDVTSNLAPRRERADHRQGGSSKGTSAKKSPKSFVVKILTSKPLGLKILQTLFANPAPVAAFQRRWGRGGPLKPGRFPELNLSSKPPINPHHQKNFALVFSYRLAGPFHAHAPSCSRPRKAITSIHAS